MRMAFALFGVVVSVHAACISVKGDKILASDLTAAIPEFSSADAGEVVGFAPIPGTTRTLKAKDLAQLAMRLHLDLDNSQGVVEDAVKRPFILYRLLLGALPF